MLLEELLTSKTVSNETVIEYVYEAEKPLTWMQLRTDTVSMQSVYLHYILNIMP